LSKFGKTASDFIPTTKMLRFTSSVYDWVFNATRKHLKCK
jgi:hypothetical protein